ncbi:hypothetical protein [Parafrankia sp. CH37]|uniref:hypothetical protein n=1 Tax=Parafrankia sp. CH37 TaxID=683308 RepID=UPI0018684E25|nr:hypothetical protein [Parafrankia sp. CH37]MBE3206748.1 hypothetical protein [Parafrankia sp. CH37]
MRATLQKFSTDDRAFVVTRDDRLIASSVDEAMDVREAHRPAGYLATRSSSPQQLDSLQLVTVS